MLKCITETHQAHDVFADHVEHLARRIVHEQRESLNANSNWSSFLAGMVLTMIAVVALWYECVHYRLVHCGLIAVGISASRSVCA